VKTKPNITLVHVKPACEDCSVRRLCLPVSLDVNEVSMIDRLVKRRKPLKKGEYLYRSGDRFSAIFAVQYGSLKTYGLTLDGKEQVTGFHLGGELLGLDAIDKNVHPCNAVALEDTEVCELPYHDLEQLEHELPNLQHEFSRIMSREILREQHMLMLLGSTSAEQRLARFLLSLYERMRERGGEAGEVRLCMTRQDIGNYLGMALETASRQMAHMQEAGIIRIENKVIKLLDLGKLRLLTG
jgi:CRP/FNR family transcriptional regulator